MVVTLTELARAVRCPEANVETNWPLVREALSEAHITEHASLVAALATIAVETAWKFLPIREMGTDAYLTRMYEGASRLGNTAPGDGVRYCGRGFIQITGRSNYTYYSHRLNVDLENNPDLALDARIAARILAQYFSDRHIPLAALAGDWKKVRRLVNGGTNGLEEFMSVVTALGALSQEEF